MSSPNNTAYTNQYMDNWSFDDTYKQNTVGILGFDGQSLQRLNSSNMALKVTVDGTNTFLALAAPGTSQSSALWQCRKIDTSTGVVITWADGNSNFDNVSSDLAALTYT